MRKIFVLIFMLAFMFIITSCGPNSDYYNLGSKTYYYYVNEPLVIDPYDFIRENNSWIGISNPLIRKYPENFYDVSVEYRKQGSKDSYKEVELNDDSMISFDKPYTDLGNDNSYEFKIHFLDKETKNEKEMINYYGVFTFKRSPAYLDKKVVNVKVNETYNLLDNVIEYNGDNRLTSSELAAKYEITYEVLLNDEEIEVTNGEVTLLSVGLYKVKITLKTMDSSSSSSSDASSGASGSTDSSSDSDASSGATGGGDSEASNQEQISLVLNYEIEVEE